MFLFNSVEIKTQITCVKILTHHILTAIGDHVYVYLKRNSQLINKIQVFQDQQVYGIELAVSERKLLVYGGSYLKVFNITSNDCEFQLNETLDLIQSDWILVAKWIEHDSFIGIVTMHNKAILYTSTNNSLEILHEVNCEEKCILYSAYIYCEKSFESLVVLSGTVFSEVILWQPFKKSTQKNTELSVFSPVLERLKGHKGVIFSINYHPKNGLICSTSDDRSAILWQVKNKNLVDLKEIKVTKQCCVNGHSSRIFRSMILDTVFITAGEDSFLYIWNFYGELLRKIETQQSSPVWALDANEKENLIITGSGDGGVSKFTIRRLMSELIIPIETSLTPKFVGFLKSGNIAYIMTTGSLYYCNVSNKYSVFIATHSDLENYVIFEVSICRKMVALGSFTGLVFIYRESTRENILSLYNLVKLSYPTRIFSLHWLSCDKFLTCQEQRQLTLVEFYSQNFDLTNFQLPQSKSKDKWTTCAYLINKKHFLVGDRRGDISLFNINNSESINTVKNAHSCLGVSYIFQSGDFLKSLGRDGYLRTYNINNDNLTVVSKDKMPYNWLAKMDKDLLLAFSGDNFVIADFRNRQTLVERNCGGGHRSWDFFRRGQLMSFVYLKDKKIHITYFDYGSILPTDIIQGFHINEINALDVIHFLDSYILISGGEDTFLRISTLQSQRLKTQIMLKSHLSSIRAIATYKLKKIENDSKNVHNFLIFTGGGRAQIITWLLKIKKIQNEVLIYCEEQHNLYEETNESETRIMDLQIVENPNEVLLFVALSDGNCKKFVVDQNIDGRFLIRCDSILFYQIRCIMKITTIKINNCLLLVTFSTDGMIAFWDFQRPKWFFHVHQSGINSYDYKVIGNKCVFLTGGDDNAIVLTLFELQDSNIIRIDSCIDIGVHCAQITGAYIGNNYFITSSIDQRIAIFKWNIVGDTLNSKFIQKCTSCIPDIQGFKCFEDDCSFQVFIHGSGFQYVNITKKDK